MSHISHVSWVLISSFFLFSTLSNLSSCPGFGRDSPSLSESVFMLLSEFLLLSPSLFSNRSHSAQKAKKSIPARSREEYSLHFRLDCWYTLMCWYSRMLINQLCPVWHHHPTHSPPASVTNQSPDLCFAGVTLSSCPAHQHSQGLQILCHLSQTGLLNQTRDRLYLLYVVSTSYISTLSCWELLKYFSWQVSYPPMEVLSRQKFPLLFLEKHHEVLPLKFTIVRRYHIYYLSIKKSWCSAIKAKQISK